MDKATQTRLLVQKIEQLPTLPVLATKILEASGGDDSIGQISAVIEQDQSICAKILRIANSAYFGFLRQITTIHSAVVLIGLNTVRSLVLGTSIIDLFKTENTEESFDVERFWIHSISSATAAKLLSKHINDVKADDLFTVALLHDIGKVIFDIYFYDEYKIVLKNAKIYGKKDIVELERSMFGTDHSVVGYWLGEKWKFPTLLLECIRYHHKPSLAPSEYRKHSYVVAISTILSTQVGQGSSVHNLIPDNPVEYLNAVGISEAKYEEVKDELREKKEDIEAFLEELG